MLKLSTATLVATLLAGAAWAGDMGKVMVMDPYARASTATAKSGAAFMQILNQGSDDRLIAARSDVAQRVELHTHTMNDEGVMRMVEVEEGFPIAAGETLMLERGGKHVMFMGLTQPFEHGTMIEVTLEFETAGEVVVEIPVDLERKADHGGGHDHGSNGHGEGHGDGHGEGHNHGDG